MKHKTLLSILLFILLSNAAIAAPPKLEFYLTKYNGYDCLGRAVSALRQAGFRIKRGTYQSEDRVGVKGKFKGAVGCSSEVPTAVVFVVSGPYYKTARRLARQIQGNFMRAEW